MSVQKRPADEVEIDPERTAELPVMDFEDGGTAIAETLPDPAVATDVFPAQVVPAGVADLADSLREVEHRLDRKIERVAALEAQLSESRRELDEAQSQLAQAQRSGAEREAALRAQRDTAQQEGLDLQGQLVSLRNELAEARAQLQSQHAALSESQQQAQQRADQQRHLERDIADLRRRAERQHEALSSWQGYRAISQAMLAESEAQRHGVDAGHATALQGAQAQVNTLRAELASARQEAAAEIAALKQSLEIAGQQQQSTASELRTTADQVTELSAKLAASQDSAAHLQRQLDALRALEAQAREGAQQFDAMQARIAALQAELVAAQERQRDTDAQLRKAAERVQRLESDAHASAAVLGNLQLNMMRLGREDTGSRHALQPAPEPTALRVLIRQEGGSDVVYPLGRRTSIGRTPDNDVQVDASWISRHHAVLLSSPDHCIVEDLNSTNGVLVNGRRVGRQILHDGDTVTVGKTEFRYQQRS